MSDTQFTPGPWRIEDGHYPGNHTIAGPAFLVSFWTHANDIDIASHARRMNDAHLIAAAPELYKALGLMMELASDPNNYAGFCMHFDIAGKALAKAGGEI